MTPRTVTDPQAGARYTHLFDGEVTRTIAVSDSVNVDTDAEGRIIGVEVIGDGDGWCAVLASLAMTGRLRIPPATS